MTERIFSFTFLMGIVCGTCFAQTYKETPEVKSRIDFYPSKTVLLYPNGQKSGKGIVENGVEITKGPKEDNELRGAEQCSPKGARKNIGDEARMDFYFPKNGNGQMVVMTPGGGYSHVSTFNEGVYGSKFLTDNGIAVCMLKYRLPNKHKTVPLDDVQNAMRYCRYHAKDWNIRQIGIMGGSAGGYLAASASVYWTDSITRPDFAVLLYPRMHFAKSEGECATQINLIGKAADWKGTAEEWDKLLEELAPHNYVNAQTPQTFIVLSCDDKQVPATNVLPYYTALIKNKVRTELHVFSYGGHGWGHSSEDIVGKGKDKLKACRKDFQRMLLRWMKERRDELK